MPRRDFRLLPQQPVSLYHPPRHALGALLLAQGRGAETADVYRADLGYGNTLDRCSRHSENVWGLHGYAECLARLHGIREAEAAARRASRALARADQPIAASFFCRTTSECFSPPFAKEVPEPERSAKSTEAESP